MPYDTVERLPEIRNLDRVTFKRILEGEKGFFECGTRLPGIDTEKEKRVLLCRMPRARFERPRDVTGKRTRILERPLIDPCKTGIFHT